MTPEEFPLTASLRYLQDLVEREVEPEEALEALRTLRADHPGIELELVWEDDFAGRPRYDLLIGRRGEPTACLSLTPQDAVPFAMRGTQRWAEAQLVEVDGRRVFVHEAMLAIDAIWNEARLLDHVVDRCLLGRELEREPIEVEADAVQVAVDRFRSERGLFDARQTERWLASRGMSVPDLERALERELSVAALRRRLVGAQAEAAFAFDPRRWDRVALVAFPTGDDARAMACVEALRAGEPWHVLAERVLSRDSGSRADRSMVFETVRRGHIETLGGFGLGDSMYLPAYLHGRGPYVVWVRSIEAAAWDDATRDAIEHELFADWLARARAEAHVRWNWGPDSDAA